MLIKPKPGARIGLEDPLCHVKTTEDLTSYDAHENFNTEVGKWFETRREQVLLSHCADKDPKRAQQDDGVTGADWPIKDSELRPRTGGPTWTDKKHT